MIGPSFIDEIDIDIGEDFFDHIDDLLDFPSEDVEGGAVGGDCNGFQGVWPAPPDSLAGSSSVFSGNSTNSSSALPTELPVPYEDVAQLEWLSDFVENAFSPGNITLDNDSSDNKDSQDSHQFHTSSPVSVLESSSSCSGGKTMRLSPETFVPGRGRARSKRPRPATFNPRSVLPLISPTSSITDLTMSISASELQSELESFAESHPSKKILKLPVTELKKKKKKLSPMHSSMDQVDSPQQPIAIRKCKHCEITKTPQWRAGPMGPKTLCNACGVRYKSGRLFPEYRPAASPTFVASLHSNSHKKVIEMRTKVDQNVAAGTESGTTPPPEFMPKSSNLLDYI